MFSIGDRVCYTEYIMRRRSTIDEVAEVIKIYGTIKDICGLHSDIAVPQALVEFDNGGVKYISLCDIIKLEKI